MENRALHWVYHEPEAVCDRIEPWEHGVIYRASRYPRFSGANTVRVTGDPKLSADQLIAVADQALAGLQTRRIDFDRAAAAEPLRADFADRGYLTMRMLWMRMGSPEAAGELARDASDLRVTEVPYDEVEPLREAWQHEDFPGRDPTEYLAQARAVRIALGQRTFAIHDNGRPIAFAALTVLGEGAEVRALYVLPEFRGDGLGTVLTRVAIDRAGPVRDLWICADDEDRPKHLYARLGFEPVVTTTWCLQVRAPVSARQPGA